MRTRATLLLALAALVLVGTLVMARSTARYESERAQERAGQTAERTAAAAEVTLARAQAALDGAAGLFDASRAVGAPEFAAYSRRALGRGGLDTIVWLERVEAARRPAWEAATGLTIVDPPLSLGPAARRDVYYPVRYAETDDIPYVRPGMDPSMEPRRRGALAAAAAEDRPAATPPVPLIGTGATGIVIVQPVYRGGRAPATPAARWRALRGFVAGAFRLDGLFADVLRGADPDVPVAIRDGTQLLAGAPVVGPTASIRTVEVGGRPWTVAAGLPEPSRALPVAILVCGGALALLAGVLAAVVFRRDRFAERAVATATAELEEGRRSVAALVANSPDVVARYDRDLRCVFANDAVRTATGMAPEDLVGRTSADAGMPADLVPLWEGALRRALAGEEGVELELTLPGSAGPRALHARLAPERGRDGTIGHVLVVSRDVTRQVAAERALRASEDRYRSLVQSMPAGIVEHDGAGVIVACNPAAEQILGITAEQMAGRDSIDARWRAVRPDGSPLPGEQHPAVRTLRSGRPVDDELMGVHRANGDLVWLSVSTRLRDATGEGGVVACFTDVTGRVEADREQAALRRVATLVARGGETRQVMELVAREAAALVGAQAAGVIRFDDAMREGTVAGIHGAAPGLAAPGTRFDLALPTAAGRVAATGAMAWLEGGGDPGRPNTLIPGAAVATAVAAPIRVGERLWGALSAVTTDPGSPLAPRTGERLTRLGELVALAVMSSDARAHMAALAATDDLTGLPNRRTFTERLAAEIDRARAEERPLSLALLDIDHFKRINDTYGHPCGDRVLKSLAAHLFGNVRDGEMVARIGGEEFAWILPGADGPAAAAAAERMRRHLGGLTLDEVGSLTVSVGVCELAEGLTGPDLLRLADGALYRAKDAGRDRVVRHVPRPDDARSLPPGDPRPSAGSGRTAPRPSTAP